MVIQETTTLAGATIPWRRLLLLGGCTILVQCLCLLIGFNFLKTEVTKNIELILSKSSAVAAGMIQDAQTTTTTDVSINNKNKKNNNTPPLVKNEEFAAFASIYNLSPDTRLCRLYHPAEPVLSDPFVVYHNTSFFPHIQVPFRYQCAGPNYNRYMQQRIFPLIQRKQQEGRYRNWGRRPTLIPLPNDRKSSSGNTKTNKIGVHKSILIIGDSLTRQVTLALLCQYNEQIVDSHVVLPEPRLDEQPFSQEVSQQYILHLPAANSNSNNNDVFVVELTVLTNNAIFYSKRWKQNLEQAFFQGQSMQEAVDVVVLGNFHEYQPEFKHAKLWRGVQEIGTLFPHFQIDLERYNNPAKFVNIKTLSRIFRNSIANNNQSKTVPIIYLTSLIHAKQSRKTYNKIMQRIQQQQYQDVHALFGRSHMDEPEVHGNDCVASSTAVVDDCLPGDGHKCIGEKGGMPDLVAWDLVEKLWETVHSTK